MNEARDTETAQRASRNHDQQRDSTARYQTPSHYEDHVRFVKSQGDLAVFGVFVRELDPNCFIAEFHGMHWLLLGLWRIEAIARALRVAVQCGLLRGGVQ